MLTSLIFVAQVGLFAAAVFRPWRESAERQAKERLPVQVRMLLSFSLVVVASLIWFWHTGPAAIYSQWVVLGMIASFIGDLIMARLIPAPNRLIGGMVAFAIAHALYITAFVRTIQTISTLAPYDRFSIGLLAGLVVYGLLTLVGWWFLIRNPGKGTVTNVGALVYGLWISVMASCALALAVALGGAFWLTALGGLFFVSSDFVIGMTDIRGIRFKHSNYWVWMTYVAGQMGIIYAGGLA